MPDAIDAAGIHQISFARLQHALAGDQPHHQEGGQYHQAKDKKGRAQVRELSHQGKGDQARRNRPDKEAGTPIGFGNRHGSACL